MTRSRRFELLWAPALYVVATLWLYRAVLAGDVGFGWDTIESYWPDLRYFAASIGSGDWPLWNPYDRGGYPFFADPQPGVTYPIQWCFALANLTTDHGWWLIQTKVLLHHVIAALTMHAFLRSRGLGRPAAVVGALTWLGSTPWLIHKASNILWPLCWLPLVWMAIDAVIRRPDWRRGVLLAAALYLPGSAGSPPGFFYVLVAAVLYGAFRFGTTMACTPKAELGLQIRRQLLALAVAAAVTVALVAITTLPGLELTDETTRAKRSIGYALSLPLPVKDTLLGLVGPAVARPSAYFGIGAVMLAVIGISCAPKRDRGAPIFFASAATLFLLLAFGSATPLLRWLVETVPGFGLFRIANRYKLIFIPLVAALAAFGAEAIVSSAKRWSRQRIASLASVAAIVGISLVVCLRVDGPPKPLRSPWVVVTIAALCAGLITATLLGPRRSSPALVGALAALIFLDPAYTFFARQPIMERQPEAGKDVALERLEGADGKWRIYDEFVVGERAGSRFRVRDFRGYPSGDPLDFKRYREVLALAGKRPELLEAFNVRYLLHRRHHRNAFRAHRIKRPALTRSEHFVRRPDGVFEAAHPAPRVAWYAEVRPTVRAKALTSMLEAETADGARAYVVIEPDFFAHLSAPLDQPGAEVPGELLSFSADRVELRVDAPKQGVVVLNEVFYPGWRVSVDGVDATPLRVNYLLRGVEVGPGAHRIVWEFRPAGQRGLTLIFGLGWLAMLIAFGSWRRAS